MAWTDVHTAKVAARPLLFPPPLALPHLLSPWAGPRSPRPSQTCQNRELRTAAQPRTSSISMAVKEMPGDPKPKVSKLKHINSSQRACMGPRLPTANNERFGPRIRCKQDLSQQRGLILEAMSSTTCSVVFSCRVAEALIRNLEHVSPDQRQVPGFADT